MGSEPARIAEIDISGPARLLSILRWSDYVLVVLGGMMVVQTVPDIVATGRSGSLTEVAVRLVLVAGLSFAAYTGWRHVGVIDPGVWRSYLLVFPFLGLFALVAGLSVWATKGWGALDDFGSTMSVVGALYYAGIAVPGFICVLLLRRARVPSTNLRLDVLLESLAARGHGPVHRVRKVPRERLVKGVSWLLAGVVVLVIRMMIPLTVIERIPGGLGRFFDQVQLFGFFLLVRARRYFQVSADAVLAVDKRPPVLFLRSFADDERQTLESSKRALLDFSLETRLANHFSRFGPFIAVGSPRETVPEPGAARIRLKPDEWQSRVLRWIGNARVIVMYSGKTRWVNWELRQLIDCRAVTRLILMFPEIRTWRPSRRKADIASRVAYLREVFKDTPWDEELMAFANFPGARAMLFRTDGSMEIVKSRSRSRDAYHLAALVAHHRMFQQPGTVKDVAPQASWRRRAKTATVALAATVALGLGIHYLSPPGPQRLAFMKGELRYRAPVTEAQARGVGEYLARTGYFSDDHATTVELARRRDVYELHFVINQAYVDDPLTALSFGVTGSALSRDVLARAPTAVVLCDTYLKPVKVLPRTEELTFAKGRLYYTAPVTEREARSAGTTLVDDGFFDDKGEASVSLSRDAHGNQLKFAAVIPARASDPDVVASFVGIGRAVAAAAFAGQPIAVYLCNDRFEPLGNGAPLPDSAPLTAGAASR